MAETTGTVPMWDLHIGDEAYPQSLREMEAPPEVIHGVGCVDALSTMCLGVIGARLATPYGMATASMAGRVAAGGVGCWGRSRLPQVIARRI